MYDLEPIRCTPFLQADLRLAPATVKRASPAFYPRPRGRLWAVDGALESQEYHRHLQLIRDQWGPTAVPLAERIEGRDHFTVLDAFVEPAHRLHRLALERLGLARGD
jgi:arylformamidase